MRFPVLYVILAALPFLDSVYGVVDQTLLENNSGKDVVEAVVRRIVRSQIFVKFERGFLRRWAYIATLDGVDPITYADGFYGGIWQISEDQFNITKNLTGPKNVYEKIETRFGINWQNVSWHELVKPFYSGLAARMFLSYHQDLDEKIFPGTVRSQKAFYAKVISNMTAEVFENRVEELEENPECHGMIDLCLVLEASNPFLDYIEFNASKRFAKNLVSTFSLASTRFSLVVFGTDAEAVVRFDNNYTIRELQSTIMSAEYEHLEYRNTPAGILKAVEDFDTIEKRSGVPQLLVTVVDGTHDRGDLSEAIASLQQHEDIVSIAIGITNRVNYSELLEIALGETKHVFRLDSYKTLIEYFYQMNYIVCDVPQDHGVGENFTGTLLPNERRQFHFSLDYDDEDLDIESLVIEADGASELLGWYSFSEPVPSSAVHDGVITSGSSISLSDEQMEGHSDIYITLKASESGGDYILRAGAQVPLDEYLALKNYAKMIEIILGVTVVASLVTLIRSLIPSWRRRKKKEVIVLPWTFGQPEPRQQQIQGTTSKATFMGNSNTIRSESGVSHKSVPLCLRHWEERGSCSTPGNCYLATITPGTRQGNLLSAPTALPRSPSCNSLVHMTGTVRGISEV